MSVIWSGVTAEGAVVPVQVTDEGKVVAIGDGPQGDYLPITGGTLTGDLNVAAGITLKTNGFSEFAGEMNVGDVYTGGGTRLLNTGEVFIRNDKGGGVGVLQVQNGSPLVADTTISFLANGSATFRGSVQSGDPYSEVAEDRKGIYLFDKGALTVCHRDRASLSCLMVADTLTGETTFEVKGDGSAEFAGPVTAGSLIDGFPSSYNGVTIYPEGFLIAQRSSNNQLWLGKQSSVGTPTSQILADGSASFHGDVVIGSRGEKWLIRESNGVAMLVQQSREAAPMSGVSPVIPEKVRDIPSELDLIEMALNEVMEKLRMTPPAGWPVWDGSDNP